MQTNVYSIRDKASKDFGLPFFSTNNDTAKRSFADLARDPNASVMKYPDDFTLFNIGTFDSETGLIEGHDPEVVANAIEFLPLHTHQALETNKIQAVK